MYVTIGIATWFFSPPLCPEKIYDFSGTPLPVKPHLISLCLSIQVRAETNPVNCLIFMRCHTLFLWILGQIC